MIPKKITVKVIISFIALLLLNHISFFLIMRTFKLEQAERDHDFYKTISTYAFKEFVDKRFDLHSIDEIRSNQYYQSIIDKIAYAHNLDVVITDSSGSILLDPSGGKDTNEYIRLINESREGTEGIRKPFPVRIPFETDTGETGSIYLFHVYDTSSADLKFNIALSLLLLFDVLLLILLSRKVTVPLGKFDKAIKAISEGNFSERISIRSNDELGKLAGTVNSMAAKIEEIINEQKDTSANISHELRSPLTRINVALQILRDIEEDSENGASEYIEAIEREIEGMNGLIDGILKYYRLDSFSVEPQERINLIEMLNNELGKQVPVFAVSSVSIINNIKDAGFDSKVYPSVRSVFENIIGNAGKYTPEGGTFTVSTEIPGNDLVIKFANDISPDCSIDTERLFEPFYRGRDPKAADGTGMGLAIAKKICSRNAFTLTACIENDRFLIELTIPGPPINK